MEQIALFIVLGIVGAGWAGLSALVIWLVQRRIRTLEARHGFDGVGMYGDLVPVAYAVALSVWPVALVVGAWQMRNPEAARQGRITLYLCCSLELCSSSRWGCTLPRACEALRKVLPSSRR